MTRLGRRLAALSTPARLGLAAIAGAVLALSQSPVSAWWLLFLAMPPLVWLLDAARGWRGAFGVGWAAGVGFFGAALFWIVDPFLVQPEVFGWMAPFAVSGMATGLALFWGLPFALARRLRPPGWRRVLALAALWALSDYARAHLLTGFPWALPAYAWVESPVIQVASLTGPHLLGLLTLIAALLPALLGWRAVAVAAALVAAGWGFGAWRLAQPLPVRAQPLVVRLVQPNAVQSEKWLPGKEQEFWDRHIALTAAPAARRPDVTIWSETAAPFALGTRPDLQAEAAAAALPGRLVLGITRFEEGPAGERWFNSLAVLDTAGKAVAVYDKHHLVPFGEYIPAAGLVDRLGLPALETLTRGGFSAGPGPRLVAVEGLPPFLPLICYEAIFPDALRAPGGRPEWLVQVTNDAWFGTASGPWQHFAQARARAIEQGLPLARAANTGISAMVDPLGRVVASIGLGETGYIDAVLPAPLPATTYARIGDAPALTAMLVVLVLTASVFHRGIFGKFDG